MGAPDATPHAPGLRPGGSYSARCAPPHPPFCSPTPGHFNSGGVAGDAAVAEQRFADAVRFFSHALLPDAPSVEILCKRASATVAFARRTVELAADGEEHVRPDAETLANMALRDIEKIFDIDAAWCVPDSRTGAAGRT